MPKDVMKIICVKGFRMIELLLITKPVKTELLFSELVILFIDIGRTTEG